MKTTHTVPSLDDILTDELNYGYYSKQSFIEYLNSIHCLENLSFILALNSYNSNPTIWKWTIIYQEFLLPNSINEINLPSNLKNDLSVNVNPSPKVLSDLKKYIYNDILMDLYLEFIKIQKVKLAGSVVTPVFEDYSLDETEVFLRQNSGSSSRGSSILSIMEGFKRRLKKTKT